MLPRHSLTEEQWNLLRPLLPPQKPHTGRPANDQRKMLNGILWILRTGAPWRDLHPFFGPWNTVYNTFARWRDQGVMERIFNALQRDADADHRIDWSIHFVDSTIVKAHQHAAGAKGPEFIGRSRGGRTTKIHVRVDGKGKPVVFLLTGGERNDGLMLVRLMESGGIRRKQTGRPRLRPQAVAGDKAYGGRKNRRYLKVRRIRAVIPTKKNERPDAFFDAISYRKRNIVERFFSVIKQNRRIATRYEKLAVSYAAMLMIAAFFLWL